MHQPGVTSGNQNDNPDKSSIPIIEDNQMRNVSSAQGAGENNTVDVLETYKNQEFNFSFDIPVLWKGHYKVLRRIIKFHSFIQADGLIMSRRFLQSWL
jgi:hypothetical protein